MDSKWLSVLVTEFKFHLVEFMDEFFYFLVHQFEQCKATVECDGNSYGYYDLTKLEDDRLGV